MRTLRLVVGLVAATLVGTVFVLILSFLLVDVLRFQIDAWSSNSRLAVLAIGALVLLFVAAVVASAFEAGSWLRRLGSAAGAIAGWCGLLMCAPIPAPPDYDFPWPGRAVVGVGSACALLVSLFLAATVQPLPSPTSRREGRSGMHAATGQTSAPK